MSKMQGFWISAKRPLVRRCRAGMCFDQVGHGVAADVLSDDQLAELQADPYLMVEEVEFDATDTSTTDAGPGGGDPSPGELADDGLSESQHTLRAYLAGLKAEGAGKPKVAEAREATGIAGLSAAEIGEAWKALG